MLLTNVCPVAPAIGSTGRSISGGGWPHARLEAEPTGRRGSGDCVIRLLVADDSPVVREGLKGIVAGCPDMTIVGEAATSEAVLEAVSSTGVDVLPMAGRAPGPARLGTTRPAAARPAGHLEEHGARQQAITQQSEPT